MTVRPVKDNFRSKGEWRQQIKGQLNEAFNLKELKALCWEIGVDVENLPPSETKQAFIENLVGWCERRGLTEQLIEHCQKLRPKVVWPLVPVVVQLETAVVDSQNELVTSIAAPSLSARQNYMWRRLLGMGVFISLCVLGFIGLRWVSDYVSPDVPLQGSDIANGIRRLPDRDIVIGNIVTITTPSPVLATHVTDVPTPTVTPTEKLTTTAKLEASIPPTWAELGDQWLRAQDGMVMVYVPAGIFTMGSDVGRNNEGPAHIVELDGFWLDQTEVSQAQFALFLNENGNQLGEENLWYDADSQNALIEEIESRYKPILDYANYPILEVSWYGANAYCAWVGGQLPSEAQWEYAARGPDALTYPWGNVFDSSLLNVCEDECAQEPVTDEGFVYTRPVDYYEAGASWNGALSMAGNVREWVNDWYLGDYYEIVSTEVNPAGPSSGGSKVVRGASWSHDSTTAHTSFRESEIPDWRHDTVGFRCVWPD